MDLLTKQIFGAPTANAGAPAPPKGRRSRSCAKI